MLKHFFPHLQAVHFFFLYHVVILTTYYRPCGFNSISILTVCQHGGRPWKMYTRIAAVKFRKQVVKTFSTGKGIWLLYLQARSLSQEQSTQRLLVGFAEVFSVRPLSLGLFHTNRPVCLHLFSFPFLFSFFHISLLSSLSISC